MSADRPNKETRCQEWNLSWESDLTLSSHRLGVNMIITKCFGCFTLLRSVRFRLVYGNLKLYSAANTCESLMIWEHVASYEYRPKLWLLQIRNTVVLKP